MTCCTARSRLLCETSCLTGRVELESPNTLRNLSEVAATKTLIETFKKAINALTVRDKGDAEIRDTIKLRQTRPFVAKDQGYVVTKKSVFNRIIVRPQRETRSKTRSAWRLSKRPHSWSSRATSTMATGRPSKPDCSLFRRWTAPQGGIPAYLAYGNHDAESQITRRLAYPDNVQVFPSNKPKTFWIDELGVALHGQSFR